MTTLILAVAACVASILSGLMGIHQVVINHKLRSTADLSGGKYALGVWIALIWLTYGWISPEGFDLPLVITYLIFITLRWTILAQILLYPPRRLWFVRLAAWIGVIFVPAVIVAGCANSHLVSAHKGVVALFALGSGILSLLFAEGLQVWHTWRVKSVEGLSLPAKSWAFLDYAVWTAYGFATDKVPVWLVSIFGILLFGSGLYQFRLYGGVAVLQMLKSLLMLGGLKRKR